MMYGFGDEETPDQESIELLEKLVIHFIQNMVRFKLNNFYVKRPIVIVFFLKDYKTNGVQQDK
jgi:hypothetical protein